MKRKSLMVLMAVSLVITLLAGCGTSTDEETDSQTVTQTKADVTTTETQEAESVDVLEETVTEEESEVEEEVTPESTEEPEATTEPTETVEPEPQYTYTDLNQTMYAKQSVNVRSLPSTDGEKLGGLSTAQEVTVTGQCNETSWYRIDYNGSVGYVSNNYLVNEKPVVEEKPAEQPVQTSGHWYDDYEKYVWYDMGNYFFIITGSEDETHGYVFSEEATGYRKILEERYPDKKVYQAGEWSYNAGGVPVGTITALHADPETGFPMWEEAGYLWD